MTKIYKTTEILNATYQAMFFYKNDLITREQAARQSSELTGIPEYNILMNWPLR